MATSSNIFTLLKFYTSKQKSPVVDYEEFASYIKKYAQHHVEENPDLTVFLGNDEPLRQEISTLALDHLISIGRNGNGKEQIFVTAYFIERCRARYQEIEKNLRIPFPSVHDLPKNVPMDIFTKLPAVDVIYKLLDKEVLNDRNLYAIQFTTKIPAIMFPSSLSMSNLVNLSLRKIQEMLHKEESHDYFLKKLSISNPGKELSIKNFFTQLTTKPEDAMNVLKNTGDTFYYWSQLFYFIKQDYTKLKDLTPEDINILQAVSVLEVATSYFKSKNAERLTKETAFKNLEMLMHNPPYYFNFSDIVKFKDPNGVPLLGQYTEQDLRVHLQELSTTSIGNDLPAVLIFKVNDEEGYFIYKDKVMQLLIRLCADARVIIREGLTKQWYKLLLDFETLPEMKEPAAFERCLQKEVRASNPILYAILNASFLPVVSFEDNTPGRLTLFRNDMLIPYSELLMLSRSEILSDAKIRLPFWYSIPLIHWFMSLLLRKPKSQRASSSNKVAATEKLHKEQVEKEAAKVLQKDIEERGDPKMIRKRELRKAAGEAEKELVPENSTLDRELNAYKKEWNNRIGKETADNLTEDINSLVRDYLRKVLRTIKTDGLDVDRISSLAESLVDSPSMAKIPNHAALKRYMELYMIKLIKNIP